MLTTTLKTYHHTAALLCSLLCILPSPWIHADNATEPASVPLYLSTVGSKPNIMLMVDSSGSMGSDIIIPPIQIHEMPPDYSFECNHPLPNTDARGNTITIKIKIIPAGDTVGTVQICTNNSCSRNTRHSSAYCFAPNLTYKVSYYDGTLFGSYLGANLNWYFDKGTFKDAYKLIAQQTNQGTRNVNALEAATDLVTSLTPTPGAAPSLRLGLARYNGGTGGTLLKPVSNLDDVFASDVKTAINLIPPSGTTPLGETLADIGRYFTLGYTGNLTLHPGKLDETTDSIDAIFNNHSILNSTGIATLDPPIQSYCQKSFVILISDGLPNSDRNISPLLADYTGDCGVKGLCDATATADNTPNLPGANGVALIAGTTGCPSNGQYYHLACKNGTKAGRRYETGGSDFLDDIAQALYEMDLRPDLGATQKRAANGTLKNNLTTYAIGLADPSLQEESVINDAARLGGGEFFFAANSADLANSLEKIISAISGQVGSSSSVTTNSSSLSTGTTIYQAKFDSADWTGNFLAHLVDSDGNLRKKTVDGKEELDPIWNAAEKIPAWDTRNILTYDPTATGTKGKTFQCADLNSQQRSWLGITTNCDSTDSGVWRLNYLRGDWSHEKTNPLRTDTGNEIRNSTPVTERIFGNRTHLNGLTAIAIPPDPWILGDIVNSNPIFVGTENYGYSTLNPEGAAYTAFRNSTAYKTRRNMVYVGGNDGMLHGFDAGISEADGNTSGREMLAYIPNAVFPYLASLASPQYDPNHRYFVDGSANVGDAYLASEWRTVLVGTTGAGAKAVFALDITEPGGSDSTTTNFSANNVLWEISDTAAPTNADLHSDAPSKRGFSKNLGYTISQAAVVRMNDGSWVALFANGYYNTNKSAVLYLVKVESGEIHRAIEAGTSDNSIQNGLSTPFPADTNGDRIADYIYAGDLRGNLWKFDVTSANASDWKVAYAGKPLYVACDATGTYPCPNDHRQPIIIRSVVGRGKNSGTYMVYFGTGKYFDTADSDLTNPQLQTFYGILDKGDAVLSSGAKPRGNLTVQTITSTSKTTNGEKIKTWRTTSNNPCTGDGWLLDLPDAGERAVTFPLLHGDRIIFTTLVPLAAEETDDACEVKSSGTGWLMELSALCGTPLSSDNPPWDVNGDGEINKDDLIDDGSGNLQSPSGTKTVGIPLAPTIVDIGNTENKFIQDNTANIETTRESKPPTVMWRQTWRQLR